MSKQCPGCGTDVHIDNDYCDACGHVFSKGPDGGVERPIQPGQPTQSASGSNALMFSICGLVAGSVISFLMRPAVPFVGQLPLDTVLARGTNLQGLDRLLVSVAETSFNYLVLGAILGGGAGAGVSYLMKNNVFQVTSELSHGPTRMVVSESGDLQPVQEPSSKTLTVQAGQTRETVESLLGRPEKVIDLGPKIVYVYKDLKLTFVDGKVSDVQ